MQLARQYISYIFIRLFEIFFVSFASFRSLVFRGDVNKWKDMLARFDGNDEIKFPETENSKTGDVARKD